MVCFDGDLLLDDNKDNKNNRQSTTCALPVCRIGVLLIHKLYVYIFEHLALFLNLQI